MAATTVQIDINKESNLLLLSKLNVQQHSVINCLFIGPDSSLCSTQNSLIKVTAQCLCDSKNPWQSYPRLAFVRVCGDLCCLENSTCTDTQDVGDYATKLDNRQAETLGPAELLSSTGNHCGSFSDRIVVHPSLIYNLFRVRSSQISDRNHMNCPTIRLHIEQCSMTEIASAKRARSIQLALSPSPHYSSDSEYKLSLFELFATQQCLYPGDIITVPVCQADSVGGQIDTNTVLYYTVTEGNTGFECMPGPFLAGIEFTSLQFSSSTNQAVATYAPRLRPSPAVPLAAGFVDRLVELMRAYLDTFSTKATSTSSPAPTPTLLLHGPSGCGKAAAALAAADRLALHVRIVRCEELTVTVSALSTTSTGTGTAGGSDGDDFASVLMPDGTATSSPPRLLLLTDANLLARRRDGAGADPAAVAAISRLIDQYQQTADTNSRTRQPLIIVGTCRSLGVMDASLLALFQLDLAVPAPDEADRRRALSSAGFDCRDELLKDLTRRSVGFNAGELWSLERRARLAERGAGDAIDRPDRENATTEAKTSIKTSATDQSARFLSAALDATLKARAASLGAPNLSAAASVDWEDVGGQEAAVAEILATVEAPLKRPELRRHRRCGLLLYGPPGVGKTLLARAAASQLGLAFLSVKGPELVNMFVGQSEANVRALFADAIRLAPCVVFFDELDSIAPARGGGGGGGAVDRIVSQLLTELDGIRTADAAVFVIGATNRADLLDRALLRPGRFDQALLIAPAESLAAKTALFRAQLRRRPCAPDVDISSLATALPPLVTGADVMSVVSNAADLALRQAVAAIDSGLADELTADCCLNQAMLLQCARELKPSVTEEQMKSYRNMKV